MQHALLITFFIVGLALVGVFLAFGERGVDQACQFVRYKGFPRIGKCRDEVLLHRRFRFCCKLRCCDSEKMADCEATNGHSGHRARTLMKDARRDLNR